MRENTIQVCNNPKGGLILVATEQLSENECRSIDLHVSPTELKILADELAKYSK